jgi:D-alanyl-D-alanine carboxypeptidase/D-alanyl-D-alanine-endopeptidase (penicillin-binding protein 4)
MNWAIAKKSFIILSDCLISSGEETVRTFLSLGFLTILMNFFGAKELHPSNLAGWLQSAELMEWIREPEVSLDPTAQTILDAYLQRLQDQGFPETEQGVWIQVGDQVLAEHQGTEPLPAASLTKIATTLAALSTWEPTHQFETLVSGTGPVVDGVLQGDLVIEGGGDPFLVWEEAIGMGNALNELGIREVTGHLVVMGHFVMNYETDPAYAGELFMEALDSSQWAYDVENQFQTLPQGTPRPQIVFDGGVQVLEGSDRPANTVLILRHQSLPLVQILKAMNVYSNNIMAEVLAELMGGAPHVAEVATTAAGVPLEEVQLINGSGLGEENRISPRAITAMLIAIQRTVQPKGLTVADLFPVAGQDIGTIAYRDIPPNSTVKTGTLDVVSSLAGAMPTSDRGTVWFAILNYGWDLDGFRREQDVLLQALQAQWHSASTVPDDLQYHHLNAPMLGELGDPARNQFLMLSSPDPTQPATPEAPLHRKRGV